MNNNETVNFIKGSLRYKQSTEKSVQVTVPLSGKMKELDDYQKNLSINLAEVYDRERQKSTLFAPVFKFQFLFSNAYSGTAMPYASPYPAFNNNLSYLNSESTKLLQLESSATIPWPGFPQYNEFCFIRTDSSVFGYTSGTGNHLNFIPQSASTYNWNYYMTYVYGQDEYRQVSYVFPDGQTLTSQPNLGLPYIMNRVEFEGKTLWQFTCLVNHNLAVGDYVYIPNVDVRTITGVVQPGRNRFEVYSLGNGFFNSDKKIFNILDVGFNQSSASFSSDKIGHFYRVTDNDNPTGSQSIYYFRLHRILTDPQDAIVTNAGFEQNAFRTVKKYESPDLTPNQVERISVKEDSQSYNISFNSEINLVNLVDNRNRPVSELFVTVINKGFFGYFNPPNVQNTTGLKEGWGFNLSGTGVPDWWRRDNGLSDTTIGYRSYNRAGLTFYYNNTPQVGDTIYGDLCEWNNLTQEETVLSEYYQKIVYNPQVFNINSDLLNPLGYYYYPHFKIKIRQFSDYIEEGDRDTTEDAPNYAYYSPYNNKLYWRDIYTYGFIDADGNGVDYPFMNGIHYPNKNFFFRLIPEGSNLLSILSVQDPIIDGCE
jgi:hypothetical protein